MIFDAFVLVALIYFMLFIFYWKWAILRRLPLPQPLHQGFVDISGWMGRAGKIFGDFTHKE